MTQLRPARPTDAGALAEILSGFVDETPWMPRVHSRAEDLAHMGELIDRGWVTLADGDHGVVGFLARENDTIHALYAHPNHRGRGIGSNLINNAKTAQSQLNLWTFQANPGAQRFYERHGFSEARRTDGAGNDEHLPDIQYVWTAAGGPHDR